MSSTLMLLPSFSDILRAALAGVPILYLIDSYTLFFSYRFSFRYSNDYSMISSFTI